MFPERFPCPDRMGQTEGEDPVMKHLTMIAALAAATCLTTATPAAAQRYSQNRVSPEEQRFFAAQERFEREYEVYQQEFERYRQWRQSNPGWRDGPGRPGPGPGSGYRDDDDQYAYDERDEGDYDPGRYYRTGPNYQERALRADERVYRGRDGKYYCKRSDGTTGLIVGAGAGALLGNIIDGGRSRTAGTLLGALVGAAAGASIERNNRELRCR
jgi:hypothetical protein